MGNCQRKEVNISKTLFYYTLLLVNLCIPGGGGGKVFLIQLFYLYFLPSWQDLTCPNRALRGNNIIDQSNPHKSKSPGLYNGGNNL